MFFYDKQHVPTRWAACIYEYRSCFPEHSIVSYSRYQAGLPLLENTRMCALWQYAIYTSIILGMGSANKIRYNVSSSLLAKAVPRMIPVW